MTTLCPKCQSENSDTAKFCSECATPLQPPKDIGITETIETPVEELTRGTTLADRYQIIEELGKGGMGTVFRVEDTKIGQDIALKLIKPEIASDKKTIERFRNELKTTRMISHRNVCRMFDLGDSEGTYFITMEYILGEDLKSFIRRVGQLPSGKAISIAKQVCEGLSEAHRLGVVHRDLKSNNVMIDKEGNARIMDFGIARSLRAKGITGEGIIIGTPEYMSPEQAEAKEVDHRSDIYSLGVILYEMVTGKLPFEGDTPLSIAMKHKGEEPKNPKALNPQIPKDLDLLIIRCLEKDKEKRYQSAEELHAGLNDIEKGIPTIEKAIPRRMPLTSKEITVTFRFKRLLIPAVVVVTAVIIGLFLWRPWSQGETPIIPSDKPSLAIMYFENNTGDENLDHWRNALPEWLITDLAQSRHIKVLSGDRLLNILKRLNLEEARKYDSADLKDVASEGRVNHILKASLSKAGETFRIDYAVQEISSGESVGSDYVMGKGEASFPAMVDELTRKIKGIFKLSSEEIARDIDKEVWKITTSFPEAYKYYVEGRKYHGRGDYRLSISFMERAIEIDSEFAVAYRSLSASHSNLGHRAESVKYLKKAFELSDRASDIERYWIQGDYYFMVERNDDKAIEAFNKLFDLDPDHNTARNNMGGIYWRLEEWDKAIENLEVCRKNKTELIISYNLLGNSYAAKGMYQKAREVVMDYIENYSDAAFLRDSLARFYACEGEYEPALVEAEKALALNPKYPTRYRKCRIYQLMGSYEDAEKEYKELLETENNRWHLEARRWLEILYRSYGQYKKAREQAKMGLELAEKLNNKSWVRTYYSTLAWNHWSAGNYGEALEDVEKYWTRVVEENVSMQNALFLKALIYLELGQNEKAQTAAEEMKIIIEGERNPKLIRDFYFLQGIIKLKNKNYLMAIDYLNRAYALMPEHTSWYDINALHVYYIGYAYLLSGDLKKAEEAFVKVTVMTTGRLIWGDLHTKSFYMLGKIHEQQGDTAKAIEHYEKFLDLWKDADPGIAEVEDARKRLAGLKGN